MVSQALPASSKPSVIAYMLTALSVAIGAGSLIVFAVFLFIGPFRVVDLGFGPLQALLFDTLLCMVFFLQHSGMIRRTTRRWLSKAVSRHYLGALFSIVSGVVLLALVLLWQETGLMLAAAEGLYRWPFRALFFLAVALQVWGTWALKSADLFGVDSALRGSDPAPLSMTMVVRGPYRWVRHPLYTTTLLMIWSYPDLSADRLLFNILFTGWILIGAVLEERDLVVDFGEAYQSYQRRVPMLIPCRKPEVNHGESSRGSRPAVSDTNTKD